MKTAGPIGNVVKLALLGAVGYALLEWNPFVSTGSDAEAFAEAACRQAVNARESFSRARVLRVSENPDGYTVRLTATLARGAPAKVVCLANANGGVREIYTEER